MSRSLLSQSPNVNRSLNAAAPTFSTILQARRDFMAAQLEEVCHRTVKPRILALDSGQFREAETTMSLCQRKGGEFAVLNGRAEAAGAFHYIYALNLFNELDTRAAQRLLLRMVGLLKPGGAILVANFTREIADYNSPHFSNCRVEEDMTDLLLLISDRSIIGHAVWRDDSDTVVYLEIQR